MATTTTVVAEEGKWIKVGDEEWPVFSPKVGCVLEVEAPATALGSGKSGVVAILVTGVNSSESTGLVIPGRFVGGEVEEINTEFSSLVNRRGHRLHLCGSDPCAYSGEADLIHVTSARWRSIDHFEESYMK